MKVPEDATAVPEPEIGEPALRLESRQEELKQDVVIDVSPPLSSFHYQVKNVSKPHNIRNTQCSLLFTYSHGGCHIMSKQCIKSSAHSSMLSLG